MPDIAEVTRQMAERRVVVPGKRLRLDFGNEGSILLDGVAGSVSNDEGAVDATIRVAFDDFKKLAQGKLNGAMAFMTGKLQIDGDMGTAMQFQSITSKLKI